MKTNLLIISDSPVGNTGLGRECRELAQRIKDLPEFNLAVAGIGGSMSHKLGYPLYPVQLDRDYSLPQLPEVWKDAFGEGEPGIIFTILNACWLEWLSNPEKLPENGLRKFLESTKIQKWCYVPVDSESLGGRLPYLEESILEGMDRILAYTQFGEDVIARSISKPDDLTHLPHGCDTSIFYRRPKKQARSVEFCRRFLKNEGQISQSTLMLGIIATNTERKDWPLALEVAFELKARGENIGIWAHTDRIHGAWNIEQLVKGFDLEEDIQFTFGHFSDEDMAWGYATCDVVLGTGVEGWGLPLSEALACGIPVVTGNYAGATEFVPRDFRVNPIGWRWNGFFTNRRPVFKASDFADRVSWALGYEEEVGVGLLDRFTWTGCWPEWEAWLKAGLDEAR